MTRRGEVVTSLISALAKLQPGSSIDKKRLMAITDLSDHQVSTGMYRLARDNKADIEILQPGQVWRVNRVGLPERAPEVKGNPEPVGDENLMLLEVVERVGDAMVASDGEGSLYLVKRIGVKQ